MNVHLWQIQYFLPHYTCTLYMLEKVAKPGEWKSCYHSERMLDFKTLKGKLFHVIIEQECAVYTYIYTNSLVCLPTVLNNPGGVTILNVLFVVNYRWHDISDIQYYRLNTWIYFKYI